MTTTEAIPGGQQGDVIIERQVAADFITESSPPINPVEGLEGSYFHFPRANDTQLGYAYKMMRESRDTFGIRAANVAGHLATLIIGNGRFESAVGVLPPEDIVLFCDNNPMTLFVQRMIIETIKDSATMSVFKDNLKQHTEDLSAVVSEIRERGYFGMGVDNSATSFLSSFLPHHFTARYMNAASWQSRKNSVVLPPPFGFEDEGRFQAMKAAVAVRSFAFYRVDLMDPDSLEGLNSTLQRAGVTLGGANLSNVLGVAYAWDEYPEVLNVLPWHPRAPILASHMDGGNSVCREIEDLKWEHFEYAGVGVQANGLP